MSLSRRNYRTEKTCRLCSGAFVPSTNGPQIYCEPCNTTCRTEGCDRPVRAKGLCDSHIRGRFDVPAISPREGNLCGIETCTRQVYARGHCNLHYQRVNLYGSAGSPLAIVKRPRGVRCSVDGCDKASRGDGLCITHYRRKQKFGHPGGAALLRAKMGEGSITDTGYRKIVVNGEYVFEHRHVLETVLGRKLRPGENAHHKDGDKLNNAPENLELWSRYQPSGQRVADKVRAAIKLLREHPDIVAEEGVRLVTLESAESSALIRDFDHDNLASDALKGFLAC